ncbi:MAG: GGDEF domain-containing protein [Cyanobacteriota bacterium]|nr:GGDEF domain-containing protein [Cyanobacteriota bacterium]
MSLNLVSLPVEGLQRARGLTLESTLQELELTEFQREFSCSSQEVARDLSQNPTVPGVILTDRGQFKGTISRRRFWEHMSRPYSLELFGGRPIQSLYKAIRTEPLILSATTSIIEAARQSLQRPAELLDEPLVVRAFPRVYRLLDSHQLLVAYARIHELTTHLLKQLTRQLEGANAELKQMAMVDGLTQIANRRRFDEYLESEWQALARSPASLALILCDIDFFKRYNDTYGHQAGDICLQKVARSLQQTATFPEVLVARYGGEEFALILPQRTESEALVIAECLRDRVAALKIPHAQSSVHPYVTLSLGVASTVPESHRSAIDLIRAADRALYRAKSSGRDRAMADSILALQ